MKEYNTNAHVFHSPSYEMNILGEALKINNCELDIIGSS